MTEINKVREGEEDNYQIAQKVLGNTVSLVEDIVNLHDLLNSLVFDSRIPPKDEFVTGSLLMGYCRYHLVIACLAIERGHLTDSCFNTRTAIESCAFAYRIKKHPHLAKIWINAADKEGHVVKSDFKDNTLAQRLLEKEVIKNDKASPDYVYFDKTIENEDQLRKRLEQIGISEIEPILAIWRQARDPYSKYRGKFSGKKMFPADQPILLKLKKRYDFCCKQIHSSIYSLANKVKAENQENRFNIIHNYCEFKNDDLGEPARRFIWTINTHKYILDVFSVIFEEAINHDQIKWDVYYNGLLAKLETHKAKHKKDIVRNTDL